MAISAFSNNFIANPKAPNVAVNAFTFDGISEVSANTLTDAFRSHLLKTQKFQVMERSNMKQILEEQEFIQSDVCDAASCGVQIGKLLGVEKIVMGHIGKVNDVYSLTVRLVSVQTGRVDADESMTIKGNESLLLTEGIPNIARKLAGLKVVEKNNSKNWLLWGGLGAAAIAGAGTTAYLLTQDNSKPAAAPDNGSVKVSW